ncbi:MAG: hypothetical protein CMP20_01830 [Rickettsiales bacterium]|nr:hypothetical protein [Rickettsiales bacterium]
MNFALWILVALVVPAVYAQSCTVDKELNFPNLNLCGAPQSDFCDSYDQRLGAVETVVACDGTDQTLCERLDTLEQPVGLCGGTEQAMCGRLEAVEGAVSCNANPDSVCQRLDAIEEFVTAPCGVPVAEFCATTTMAQSDQTAPDVVNPAEIMCLASPVGEIRFLKLGASCPCGFIDKTSDYENRFVSIGGTTDFIGSAASGTTGALGSRTTTVTSTLSGVTSQQQMWAQGRETSDPLLIGQGPFMATGPVATADVAPSLALMVCERAGSCDCDV